MVEIITVNFNTIN